MKTIDHAIRKTALEHGLSDEEVRKIVVPYWEQVFKKIVSAENTTVTVRHVGSFTVSKFKLRKYIIQKIHHIKKIKAYPKYSEAKTKEILDKNYEKLRVVLYHRNIIAKRYAEKFGDI